MADIYSLQFDEVITYLSSPSDVDWTMTRASGSKAFLFWLNIADNSGTAFQYYYSTGGVSDVGTFNAFTNETTNTYSCRPQEANRGAISDPKTFPSGWVLVCHQYNRDIFKWEMIVVPEGGLASRATAADTLIYDQTLDAPNIGRRKDGNVDRYYGGKIGAISVTPYNTLLTNVQLESLAASFLNYDPTSEFTPVLHFPFNEGAGSTVVDTVKSLTLSGIGITGSDWVLEGSTGGGLDVNLATDSYSYTANPLSINLNTVIDLQSPAYTYNANSLNVDVTSDIAINLQSPTYNYVANALNIELTPEITINLAQGNYSYSAQGMDVTPTLTVELSQSNYNYAADKLNIDVGAELTVNLKQEGYAYTAEPLNVTAQGEVIVTLKTTNYIYNANKLIISTGGVQDIGTVTAGFKDDDITVSYALNNITVKFGE